AIILSECLRQPSGFSIPNPGCPVITCGDDLLSIWRKGSVPDYAFMSPQHPEFASRSTIPQIRFTKRVLHSSNGNYKVAIGGEGSPTNRRSMPVKCQEPLSRLHIPNDSGAISRSGSEAASILARARATQVFLIRLKPQDFASCSGIINADSA